MIQPIKRSCDPTSKRLQSSLSISPVVHSRRPDGPRCSVTDEVVCTPPLAWASTKTVARDFQFAFRAEESDPRKVAGIRHHSVDTRSSPEAQYPSPYDWTW